MKKLNKLPKLRPANYDQIDPQPIVIKEQNSKGILSQLISKIPKRKPELVPVSTLPKYTYGEFASQNVGTGELSIQKSKLPKNDYWIMPTQQVVLEAKVKLHAVMQYRNYSNGQFYIPTIEDFWKEDKFLQKHISDYFNKTEEFLIFY